MNRNKILVIFSLLILLFSLNQCTVDRENTGEKEEKPVLQLDIKPEDKLITPNRRFFSITIGDIPKIEVKDWSLEVGGEVEHSFAITYDELLKLPSAELTSTFECIGNAPDGKAIGSAVWKGTPLREILKKAKPKAEVKEIVFYAADGYFSSLTLSESMEETTLLVYEMNGQKLPRDQGFPVRLINPNKYGVKNPMWLIKIEAVNYKFEDYWEKRGWDVDTNVKISSKIIFPRDRKNLKNEEILVWGYVWGGEGGLDYIEISFDSGNTWTRAEIEDNEGKRYLWKKWKISWTPAGPGKYVIISRAFDKTGNAQPFLNPDNLSGNNQVHRIEITVK
ncbi:MAG TPA: hypothetical protein ENN73_03140 [Firmicutes bacterium]|nr:hypothetical protein [Bacillota bacterium]